MGFSDYLTDFIDGVADITGRTVYVSDNSHNSEGWGIVADLDDPYYGMVVEIEDGHTIIQEIWTSPV